MGYQFAIKLDDMAENTMMRLVLEKQPILLVHYENQIYAIQDACPHMGASLAKGTLSKGRVICPKHKAQIDVKTGEILSKAKVLFLKLPTQDAKVYPVKIEDGKIFVEV